MASGLVRGRNMITIEEEDVAEAMSKDHTIIFKGMQKEYPNTIYLYIEERKTVAAMQWLGILYTLDREGVVMKESTSSTPPAGMPVVTGFRVSNINVGQQLLVRSENQMEAYREIMEELELQMYQSQVAEINLADPSNIYLITVEGVTVRLGRRQLHAGQDRGRAHGYGLPAPAGENLRHFGRYHSRRCKVHAGGLNKLGKVYEVLPKNAKKKREYACVFLAKRLQ